MMRPNWFIILPVCAFVVVCALDIVRESPPWDMGDIALDIAETALLVLMVVAVAWSTQRVTQMRDDQQAFRDALVRHAAQGADWRAARSQEIAAMSDAIALEFRAWGLTGEEMDVAELLLKGASLKEIALAQRTSLAQVRDRANAVYRKAGISGRVALSAYFLDSLFAQTARHQ
ncbi:helix-turn-helix transcriptional regulator [Loktanella sp. S4079]|uniref:helix-turn-helix transcriptional regulator n=1 Tax=Loktanella sp. S4079 TaxID=579483 RepID=UPI0012ED913E|nr:helix-turn-helix transcriptional regulator [Loktanella sp. S4079]